MWSALGLNGLLGATKRRMLSLADAPPVGGSVPFVLGVELEPAIGGPLVVGAGILEISGC